MKKYIISAVGALAISSCASFDGAARADHNGDGLVSKEELMAWQRRFNAESDARNSEIERFRHVEEVLDMTQGFIDRFNR